MILDNQHTWSVSVTFPIGSTDARGEIRRWAHNDTITVVAKNAARAIEMVLAQWPTVRIWAVNHVGSRTILMVDVDTRTFLDGLNAAAKAVDGMVVGGRAWTEEQAAAAEILHAASAIIRTIQ